MFFLYKTYMYGNIKKIQVHAQVTLTQSKKGEFRMNRKITLFIILGLVLLLIPLFAAAEDDFKVTFSSTNVKPKETITATINNLNPGNTIVEVKWSEKQYGFSGSLTSVTTLKIDSQTNSNTMTSKAKTMSRNNGV